MSYTKIIEIYRITNCDFVSPLAIAPATQVYRHDVGDFLFIIDNAVWIKNTRITSDELNPDEYSQAAYSPEFVRINNKLFEKIS